MLFKHSIYYVVRQNIFPRSALWIDRPSTDPGLRNRSKALCQPAPVVTDASKWRAGLLPATRSG